MIQRNKLFNCYNQVQELIEVKAQDVRFDRGDIQNTFKLVEKLKGTEYLTPHYLYEIPKKTHTNKDYEEGELTE